MLIYSFADVAVRTDWLFVAASDADLLFSKSLYQFPKSLYQFPELFFNFWSPLSISSYPFCISSHPVADPCWMVRFGTSGWVDTVLQGATATPSKKLSF